MSSNDSNSVKPRPTQTDSDDSDDDECVLEGETGETCYNWLLISGPY